MKEKLVGQSKKYYLKNPQKNCKYEWQCLIFKTENGDYFIGIESGLIDSNGKQVQNQTAKYRDIRYNSLDSVTKKLKEKIKLKKEKGYTKAVNAAKVDT